MTLRQCVITGKGDTVLGGVYKGSARAGRKCCMDVLQWR
jgi:hypothetical protein